MDGEAPLLWDVFCAGRSLESIGGWMIPLLLRWFCCILVVGTDAHCTKEWMADEIDYRYRSG